MGGVNKKKGPGKAKKGDGKAQKPKEPKKQQLPREVGGHRQIARP